MRKEIDVMKALGITAPTLDKRLKKYGIDYKLFKKRRSASPQRRLPHPNKMLFLSPEKQETSANYGCLILFVWCEQLQKASNRTFHKRVKNIKADSAAKFSPIQEGKNQIFSDLR